jgi:flagellar basal-body rod protein FlgC
MPDFPRPLGLLPTLSQPSTVRPMFRSMAIAASGLSAQRARIETIATNLANAETTRTGGGGPYKRQVAVLQAASQQSQLLGATMPQTGNASGVNAVFGTNAFQVPAFAGSGGASFRSDDPRSITVPVIGGDDDGLHGVRVAEVAQDSSDGPLVYDPGHPDADANGYVRYPNVRISDEMVSLLDARRIYEANATVFQSAKAMMKRAIDI